MDIFCGLIKGRHALPPSITEFIYTSDIPQAHICDADYMESICMGFVENHPGAETINVYITGFTPALMALIKVCSKRGIHINGYNYDREKRTFWKQEVI